MKFVETWDFVCHISADSLHSEKDTALGEVDRLLLLKGGFHGTSYPNDSDQRGQISYHVQAQARDNNEQYIPTTFPLL